jgi:hypothetical protein
MSVISVEPMVFIETFDDDVITTIFPKLLLADFEKYDQLSQIDTCWKVVKVDHKEYDADDEEEEDIKTIKLL